MKPHNKSIPKSFPASFHRSIYGTTPEQNQQGFILITVLLLISLIASVAYLSSTHSVFNASQAESKIDSQKMRYAAETGLVFATAELAKDLDCTGYTITPNGTFNGYRYRASLSATSGSPVTVNVSMDLGSGNSRSFSREVTVTKNNETEVDLEEDSYSNRSDDNRNYGEDQELHVRARLDRITFLKFDMGKINIDPAAIIGAELKLYQKSSPEASTFNIRVYRITKRWKEREVTYDDRYNNRAWTKNMLGVITDVDPTAIDSVEIDKNVVDWKIWDVTSLVIDWLDGTSTDRGMALSNTGIRTNSIEFLSRESSDIAKRPKLVITHQCECGTAGC